MIDVQNPLNTAPRRGIRRLGLAIACSLAAMLTTTPALSKPTFALTCIGTETGSTINFQYRWGADGEWRTTSVRPGKWQLLSFDYSYPGENSSPQLYIRFDDDMTAGINYKVVRAPTYAASRKDCETQGWTLNFYERGDRLRLVNEEEASTSL